MHMKKEINSDLELRTQISMNKPTKSKNNNKLKNNNKIVTCKRKIKETGRTRERKTKIAYLKIEEKTNPQNQTTNPEEKERISKSVG